MRILLRYINNSSNSCFQTTKYTQDKSCEKWVEVEVLKTLKLHLDVHTKTKTETHNETGRNWPLKWLL